MTVPRRTAGDRVRRLTLADAAATLALPSALFLRCPSRSRDRRAALLTSLSQPCDEDGHR